MVSVNELVSTLGNGHANAIKGSELCTMLNIDDDRQLRGLVEKARCLDYPIINRQDGKGYYISDNTDDLITQYRQMTNRAMSILKSRKHIRRMLKARGVNVK